MLNLDKLSDRLKTRKRNTIDENGRPTAGVLIALYGPAPDYMILYTVRTHKVEHHKGEISFPGGGRDPVDESIIATALRESWEEIGIDMTQVQVLGLMDDTTTISNFVVTPVVGKIKLFPYSFRPFPEEVDQILEVPLSHLTNPANHVSDPRPPHGRNDRGPSYRFGNHIIFGATANMTTDFLGFLSDS